MTSRQLRLLRGAAAASVATIIAAVSHTVGGGAAPHPLLIAALSVFLTPIAALLIGRRASIVRLSAVVLLSQSVFHVLFVALNATVTPAVANAGHQHTLSLVFVETLGSAEEAAAPDTAMLGAHVVAAVLTTALLWRGETVLRAIHRWVRAVLRRRALQPHADWPVPASIADTTRVFVSTILVGDVRRRGPPTLSCV
ncbi:MULTISPECIES: hypothetical protein [unclassified Microbacterium]|uniref:hypothetical protein n=1 Tax=unclassified Microbacterium TaxID=2609290 RepID=UPI001DCF3265|nr:MULTISPECIES: hypothetical protein [unclassified Microbacterium]CAH0138823.1 hypothetical protein SRABI121_00965 [Microbacterium sp. Bi121]HWK77374.1 hypothetical protein [Microbacterium sp.]